MILERRYCTATTPMPMADKARFQWGHGDAEYIEPFFNLALYTCPNCGLTFPANPPSMKNIGTITIDGQAHQLHQAFYGGGRLAILIDEGRWGKLTVNVPGEPLAPGRIHVKTWEENQRVREPALATGLFEDTGERVPAGPGSFVQAEVWIYRGAQ